MNIWKKPYTLRRFTEQKNNNGYMSQGYKDITVSLDVQPVDSTQTQVTVNGKRMSARITSYGSFPIQVEDTATGKRADWLFYNGHWFECDSSVYYEHTPLAHYTSQFVMVSEAIKGNESLPPAPVDATNAKTTTGAAKKPSTRKKKTQEGEQLDS